MEDIRMDETSNVEGSVGYASEFHSLLVSVISHLAIKGGNLVLSVVVVGCVGISMVYIINGIFVLSYILTQLVIGDGREWSKQDAAAKKENIYQLIYEQILLYPLWKSKKPKKDSGVYHNNIRMDHVRELRR